MTFKTLALATTALSLTVGTAWAQSNEAQVDQSGVGNEAFLTQSGGEDNFADLNQGGDANDADLIQSGSGNSIGLANVDHNSAGQNGDENVISVEQATDGNKITQLGQRNQNADGRNTAIIVQNGGNGNSIDRVRQNIGNDQDNTLTITQTGTGNRVGAGQVNVDVAQSFGGQSATITQQGDGNRLDKLSQTDGSGNEAILSFVGDDNGAGFGAGPASGAGATARRVVQEGAGNFINLDVTASRTAFGIQQFGDGNTVGTIDINGDDNAVGVSQDSLTFSTGNTLTLSPVDGSGNSVGVTQTGFNDADLAIVGLGSNGNALDVDQQGPNGNLVDATIEGSSNIIAFVQTANSSASGSSQAVATIDGDGNLLNVDQTAARNSAGPQSVDVSITGDDNNNAGGFSDDAALVAGGGLFAGDLKQSGSSHSVKLTVEGNSNLFATAQGGRNGDAGAGITGVIEGNFNQAVVRQNASGNVANFSQLGNSNNLGIRQ